MRTGGLPASELLLGVFGPAVQPNTLRPLMFPAWLSPKSSALAFRQLEASGARSGTSTRLWPIPYKNARRQKPPANHGLEQCASLADSPIEKSFTPILGTESSPEQLKITIWNPAAAFEIMRSKILHRRASRDHHGLVASDFKPDLEEETLKGIKEQFDCWCLTGDRPVIQKEGFVVQVPGPERAREGRPVGLLCDCGCRSRQPEDWSRGGSKYLPKEP